MTTTHHFTYKELLMFGWEKTKEHFWLLAVLFTTSLFITLIASIIPVVSNIVSMLISIATISVLLRIVEGHTPRYRDLLKPFDTYKITWHFFLGLLLIMVLVFLSFGIGMLFFSLGDLASMIIGGIIMLGLFIYFGIRLQFFRYFILEDENLGPIDAFKKSMDITQNLFWKLFGFSLILAGINLLGLLALGIGLLFTIPTSLIAYTLLYKKLSQHDMETHEHHQPGHNHHHENHQGSHIAAV